MERVRRPGWLRPVSPVAVAAVLMVAQLAVRGWVAGRGYFYWDDLILAGRAARYPLLSADLLLYNHDGHLMPMAFALAWVLTRIAPLVWAGPVVVLVVWQAAASVAVLRMLVVLLGRRWIVLVPLVFYLFCPLTVPAFAWWAAASNALPLQCALACAIGDAVLLVRTGRVRYAVSGIAALTVGLLFFEKAVVVPVVAFAVAALLRHVEGSDRPIRTVARRAAPLWIGSALVLACWAAVYLATVKTGAVHSSPEGVRRLLHSATSLGIVPALLGGPWSWARWMPATPWAVPPGWAVVAAWLVLGAVLVVTVCGRRRTGAVWIALGAYVIAAQVPVALIRGGPNTAAELMQSLRYLADVAVVLTAAGALLLRSRPRRAPVALPGRRTVIALTALFVASSLWSTATFVRSWSPSPTRTYLTTVRAALARSDAPLLDQELPWNVLTPLAYPQNLASRALAPIAPAGAFADSTPRLRMITDTGEIVDAQVWWNRALRPGPDPGCGYRIDAETPRDLPLDGPLLDRGWTAQLNYLADRDGRLTVALEHGPAVVVPVRSGLGTVYVRLIGSGSALRIGSHTPDLNLCLGVGPIGVTSYAR
ncbi:hypothetical protein CRH09_15860 [Nocardia terpenica]|uniref:DUF2079 domain-containing protein n=2 Tax=Nocardia terpenica TaxID=455432 RepID=A0A291RWX6_9NOCA|nr:hypothetical protein CRH09_15860 [Nocardia terpenica]